VQVLDLEPRRIEERRKGKKKGKKEMGIDAKPGIFWPHTPFKN
jgi:hypothetical protein